MSSHRFEIIGIFILVIALTVTLGACDEEGNEIDENGFDFVESLAFAGNRIDSPEEVGADYVEPGSHYTNLDITFAEFTARWNDASDNLDIENLWTHEYNIIYSVPGAGFEHSKEYWTLEGLISYDEQKVEEAEVMFDLLDEMTSQDFDEVTSTMFALIYATNGNYDPDEVMEVADRLGILDFAEMSPEEMSDYEQTITYVGVTYELRIRTYSGYLLVYPEGYWD